MKRELICFGEPSERAPLLLIHGSYCGAWIWQPHFLPALAQAGWYGAALSLRGHGQSEGREKLNAYGVADYLEDIEESIALWERPPVLIGHSMGGYLAQKYALDHRLAGLALLASPSLMGLGGSAQHIALKRPTLALELANLMTLGPARTNARTIIDALVSDPHVAATLAAQENPLQGESARFSYEAAWPDPRMPHAPPPTFVLGGEDDAFIPLADLLYEDATWRGELKILEGAPHGFMLDPCWPQAIEALTGWLTRTVAAKG